MARIGRPPSCLCGECTKCLNRARSRERYRRLSMEERRALIARRNPERVRANERARYRRHREKRIALAKRLQAEHPEWHRKAVIAWRNNKPEARRAHWQVADAIKAGRLVRQPCEACGAAEVHAHHEDYSKPLDVRWLCPAHHAQRHQEIREEAA